MKQFRREEEAVSGDPGHGGEEREDTCAGAGRDKGGARPEPGHRQAGHLAGLLDENKG